MTQFLSAVLMMTLATTAALPPSYAHASGDDVLEMLLQKQAELGAEKQHLADLEAALNQATEDLANGQRTTRNKRIVYAVATAGLVGVSAKLLKFSGGPVELLEAVTSLFAGMGLLGATTVASGTLFYLSYRNLCKLEDALKQASEAVQAQQTVVAQKNAEVCQMLQRMNRACAN